GGLRDSDDRYGEEADRRQAHSRRVARRHLRVACRAGRALRIARGQAPRRPGSPTFVASALRRTRAAVRSVRLQADPRPGAEPPRAGAPAPPGGASAFRGPAGPTWRPPSGGPAPPYVASAFRRTRAVVRSVRLWADPRGRT